ncbi:MAG: sigma-70 family RNA polymerase sigma factor [Ruminococcus sp.]|nr:sigma-70 family RNA polymerase sigma factor [Ruminococcus sp.]
MNNSDLQLSAEELVNRYSAMIYRLAYARLGSSHDAEDITQEVLLKYIRANKTYTDEEHRKAWLLKVTINAIKSFATSAYNRHRDELEKADNITYEMDEPTGMTDAVAKLPEKYRTVIHLFYYEELSVKEIAKITGNTEGTVKSQLTRGREKLRQIMEEEQYV